MERRSRVLVIGVNYAPEATGIAPYTRGMVRGLAREFDVQVVTTHPHYPEWRIAGDGGWRTDERMDGVRVRRVQHYLPRHPNGMSRVVSETSFAARVLRTGVGRPDAIVVVTPALMPVAAGLALARRWRVPVGVVVQDVYAKAFAELGLMGGRLDGGVLALEGALLRGANSVVAIHQRMADTIVRDLQVPAKDISVIPNWAHVKTVASDRLAVRRRLGWDDGRFVVVHAGNMGAKQGLEHLVPVAELADARGSRVRFVVVGSGGRRSQIEAAAGHVGSLEFMDALPDDVFMPTLSAADALLLHERPGMKEMCVPSKLTTYFSAGRPVVAATDAESAASFEVAASGAGRVVEPGNPAALLDEIDRLTHADLDALGAAGVAYAIRTLDEGSALHDYRAWVRDLLSGRRRSSGDRA